MKSRRTIKIRSRGGARGITRAIAADGAIRRRRAAQALLVLGMHRSGTSALTRVFSLLGANLPKSVIGPDLNNQAGYWESVELNIIHDELLASAGSQWDDWRAFNPDWLQSGVA